MNLPEKQHVDFCKFLQRSSLREADASAMHKILWLSSLLERQPPPRFRTIDHLARCLRGLGPTDEQESARQAAIVYAFTSELRASRRVSPPLNPSPPLPQAVFLRAVETIKPDRLYRLRALSSLLLAWRTGMSATAISHLRHGALKTVADGMVVQWDTHRNCRPRDIPVPFATDSVLCAVNALRTWLKRSGIPDDPNAYVFPLFDHEVVLSWYRPQWPYMLNRRLQRALDQIGEGQSGYDFTSIRRSFALRCRDRLGPAAALYLTGYTKPVSLQRLLRAQPDWNQLPPSLLE